jgi:hypothetical protein
MESEKQAIAQIREKMDRGEPLTPREERMLAYSPYGTVAKSSFGFIPVDTDESEE